MALYPIIDGTSVHLRGWDFPHIDASHKPIIDLDWVGQESEWDMYLEVWRFYRSGQFVDFAGFSNDWRNQSKLSPSPSPPEEWKPMEFLGIASALYRFTEIFEFAARLSMTEAGDETMIIEGLVSGLQGRALVVDSPSRWPMMHEYEASIIQFPYKKELPRTRLVAEARELALEPAIGLFEMFGWDATKQTLLDMQAELRR